MLADYFIFVFAYLSFYIFTDDEKVVFGNVSDKGRSLVIESDVRFVTGINVTVAKYDRCVGVAFK